MQRVKLFDDDKTINVLPCDGEAIYCSKVLSGQEADGYFERLMAGIDWKHDEAVMFGKRITTRRMVAWYGDRNFSYTYSKIARRALRWTEDLRALKQVVSGHAGASFNSCLLNLYHNGSEGMGWHTDDEKELEANGVIASLSLGAERRFLFRHKRTQQVVQVVLEHGSLLVMKGETQTHWLHRLPPATTISQPRINLTFRTRIAD